MSDKFDMYGELLGLPPGPRPPDHYALIGVARTETDEARIHAAARRQIARLSRMLGGAQAKFAQQLMGEIATARAVLTTPVVRARYDAQLAERAAQPTPSADAPIPSDKQNVAAAAAGAAKAKAVVAADSIDIESLLPPPAVDPLALQRTVTIEAPLGPDYQLPPPEAARWARPVTPLDQPEGPPAPPPVPKARLVARPGAALAAENLPTSEADEVVVDLPPAIVAHGVPAADLGLPVAWGAGAEPSTVDHFAPLSLGNVRKKKTPAAKRQGSLVVIAIGAGVLLLAAGVFAGALMVGRSSVAQREPASPQEVWQETTGRRPPQPQQYQPAGTDQDAQAPRPPLPKNKAMEKPAASRKAPGEEMPKAADPPASEPPRTEPEPAKMPDTSQPDDPDQVRRVRQTLQDALTSIRARQMDRAADEIDQADLEAASPKLGAEVDDLRVVHHYVKECLDAVQQSVESLRATDELEVDGEPVGVAEVRLDADKIILRMKGENRPFLITQLPPNIAAALAARRLESFEPNAKTFIGALLATSADKKSAERGRKMLDEAKSAGRDGAEEILRALER